MVEFSQDQVSQNFNLNSFKQKVILFIKKKVMEVVVVNLNRLSELCQASDIQTVIASEHYEIVFEHV